MKTIAIQPVAVLSKPRPRRLADGSAVAVCHLAGCATASAFAAGHCADRPVHSGGLLRWSRGFCHHSRGRYRCRSRNLLMAFGFMPRCFSSVFCSPPVRAGWECLPLTPEASFCTDRRLCGGIGWSICPRCTSGISCGSGLRWRWRGRTRMALCADGRRQRRRGSRCIARVVQSGVVMGMAALADGCVRKADPVAAASGHP